MEPTRAFAVDSEVCAVRHICREHVLIEVVLRRFPPSMPGQFAELSCDARRIGNGVVHTWSPGGSVQLHDEAFSRRTAFLRRPFSIADREQSGDQTRLAFISRAIGPGTGWLDTLRVGDKLNLSGPFGRGFASDMPEERPVLLVGGGVGIPPLLYLARTLHMGGKRDVTVVFGATTVDLLPVAWTEVRPEVDRPTRCVALPGEAPYGTVITTDDGSCGLRGRVTDGIARWREQLDASAAPLVYACGPEPMLQAIAGQARALDYEAQLCIERIMGCGMGTCLSCVVPVRDEARAEGWRWALSCSEGPVFDSRQLRDYAPLGSDSRPAL